MMFLPSVGVWKRKIKSSSTDDDSHSGSVADVLRGPNANGDIVGPSEVQDESRYEDEEPMFEVERRHYLAEPECRQEVDLDDSVGRDDGIADRLCKAKQLGEECRLLCAASIIEDIDPKYYELEHHNIMKDAGKIKAVLRDCASSATFEDDEWTKQVEQHGKHEFSVYTKMDEASNKFSYRLETPIEASMLIPILSVFNETELFITWFPRYKFPKYQMTKSEKLVQLGRASQIVLLQTENQWPVPRRELLLKAVSCANLQEDEESRSDASLNPSRIVVSIQSLDTENDGQHGLNISPSATGKRVAVDAGLVFEASPEADSGILFTWTFSMTITKKFALPLNFFNFLLKFAMPRVWVMLLRVAEEIKDGKRPAHIDAIQRKRGEFYDWMEECVSSLLGRKSKDGTRMMLNEEDKSDSNCTKCFSLGSGRFSPAGVVNVVDASVGANE